ncbi:MAG: hypothetical protein D3914_06505 [Candidatus Electrothrix sp. LOE2]|nr:hypothetical protein [Candidatus Electrothrix sp. LOE2]
MPCTQRNFQKICNVAQPDKPDKPGKGGAEPEKAGITKGYSPSLKKRYASCGGCFPFISLYSFKAIIPTTSTPVTSTAQHADLRIPGICLLTYRTMPLTDVLVAVFAVESVGHALSLSLHTPR